MKTMKLVLIILVLSFVFAGCGDIYAKTQSDAENTASENETYSQQEVATISPTPTEDIGFAYRDQYMGLIVIVKGQGWKYDSDIKNQSVIFFNENIPTQGDVNMIILVSALKEENTDKQIQFLWEQMAEDSQIEKYDMSDITVGSDMIEIDGQMEVDDDTVGTVVGAELSGVEYQFEQGGRIGKAAFWEGTDNLYCMIAVFEDKHADVFIEAYESIINTFMEYSADE